METKIRIDASEVADPRVDAALAQQGSFGMRVAPDKLPDRKASLLYRPWFALMVAGALGGLAGWAVIEPFTDDGLRFEGRVEQVTPSPLSGASAELRVSGVRVLLLDDRSRLHRNGAPIGLGDLDGARRVSVRGHVLAQDGKRTILAYEVAVLNGEAPAGDVSLAAIILRDLLLSMVVFPIVAAFVGLFVAAADGMLSHAWRRGALCGLVGLSSGLALGLITSLLGQFVYSFGEHLIKDMRSESAASAVAFTAQMVVRGLSWAVTGAAMGLGQGIALRSKRLLLNGLLGGVVGALLGGMLFDPIDRLLHGDAFGAGGEVSRAVGFAVIGLIAGLMIGVVELLARDAWLKMLVGPLAGKEFMLFKSPTTLGSSPKSDIYLFKDAEVEPSHALIHVLGESYELEARGHTRLNGRPVNRVRLEPGDQIAIGKTVLSFGLKER